MGCHFKRQVHSTKYRHKNLERSHTINLVACLKALEQKEEISPKENKLQETIKLGAEINKIKK